MRYPALDIPVVLDITPIYIKTADPSSKVYTYKTKEIIYKHSTWVKALSVASDQRWKPLATAITKAVLYLQTYYNPIALPVVPDCVG